MDRGTRVKVLGKKRETERAGELIEALRVSIGKGHTPIPDDVGYVLREMKNDDAPHIGTALGEFPAVLRSDLAVKSRTRGQKAYLEAIDRHDVVIVIGPAGTGKTYLAMAAAVSALLNKKVESLVLTRPAVEAGENLGFLPGDLHEKVNPYLRPLYDALYAMVDRNRAQKLFDREQIEVAPLAFMRGRTLSRCFAILDEAQNTTPEQLKMFLTRLGEGSRAIVTGDVTQIDLPEHAPSGLVEAARVLKDTEGVAVVQLDKEDVVRHPLVRNIVEAYETDRRNGSRGAGGAQRPGTRPAAEPLR